MKHSNQSQEKRILEFLSTGRPLNPIQALNKFGCFRLGARCWSLKKAGHNIESKLITVGKERKRVSQYKLIK